MSVTPSERGFGGVRVHSERKREAALWLGLDRSGGVETGQRGLRATRPQAG